MAESVMRFGFKTCRRSNQIKSIQFFVAVIGYECGACACALTVSEKKMLQMFTQNQNVNISLGSDFFFHFNFITFSLAFRRSTTA